MSKLVIKIGGSFLTKKAMSEEFPGTLDLILSEGRAFIEEERLKSISVEVQAVCRKHQVMIIHGAGPFGHALVDRILSGASIETLDVHRSMLFLNDALRAALHGIGVNGVTTSPLDCVLFDGKFRTGELTARMMELAKCGNVPISHGDIVRSSGMAGRLGDYEVISGDVVARDLSLDWRADSVIMVTDTDGILDRDPAISGGKRIPRIEYHKCIEVLRGRAGRGADVTGGILQKVTSCREPIFSDIPLKIISGLKRGNLTAAAEGAPVGTTIESG
jgi:isopentenyl phosphate kinase